jgi:pimeloyl-ACP methyl ester carboxylesterase
MIANLILMGPTDLGPALESLDRPVLFVASSLDWAVAEAKKVRGQWPNVHVEVIDESSHALFVDQPEQFNRVLEEFLSTLPATTTRSEKVLPGRYSSWNGKRSHGE